MTDTEAVLTANAAFYRAIEALDDAAMAACWTRTPADTCIHPGWPILRGWTEVLSSWRAIFAGTTYMRFVVSEPEVVVDGNAAQVTCYENLYVIGPGGTQHAQVAATNIFVRTVDGWRVRLHHGSPVHHAVRPEDHDLDES